MADILIINEKPSVSQEFKRALKVESIGKKDGYIEGYSPVLNCNVQITWCVGHLVTLSYPQAYDEKYSKWNIEDLPFLPEIYKYEVISDVKKQFNVVKQLLNNVGKTDFTGKFDKKPVIFYAGDPAREGIYIQALVRNTAKHNPNAIEKVVWIDSQTDEEIKKGIYNAKPYSEYLNLIQSGYERAIEDYATGINISRALSVKFGNKANYYAATSKYKPIAVGRVMSCVLGMIVEREREILNFKVTPFYKIENSIENIEAEWKVTKDSKMNESILLYNENGFKQEKDALDFIKTLPQEVIIDNIERKIEKKYAPLLYNIAELQNECTKRFKISPDQTLSIAQSLYEKKLTTYPRTDARVLSTAIAIEINKNLNGIANHYSKTDCSKCANYILKEGLYKEIKSSHYTDDSKISDHYAIIPTGHGYENYESLSTMEKNVYDLIVRRFLSIFLAPAEFSTVKLTESADNEKFYASTKVLVNKGYLAIANTPIKESSIDIKLFDKLKKGTKYKANYYTKKGETAPPKRYTSGSMILAMENAGKLIEDEELREQIKSTGIGTSATRAETIKKLVSLNYINQNSKTQILTPACLGNIVYEIINITVPELLSPKMTASWEKGLEGIVKGEVTSELYRKTLNDYIKKEVKKICDYTDIKKLDELLIKYKDKNVSSTYSDTKDGLKSGKSSKAIAKCPECGGDIIPAEKNYFCSNYKSGCKFTIFKNYKNMTTLTNADVIKLCNGKIIKKKLKSRAGREWEQKLIYSEKTHSVEFIIELT